jgi:hypothetical protein
LRTAVGDEKRGDLSRSHRICQVLLVQAIPNTRAVKRL